MSGIQDPLDSPPPDHPLSGVLPAMSPSIDTTLNLSTIFSQLSSLAKAISNLSPPPTSTPLANLPQLAPPTDSPTSEPVFKLPRLLSTLSDEAIIKLLHRKGTDLPSVCPCITANASDTKTHWTLEELHWAMGCCKFWNYKHILQVSRDGEWMNGGVVVSSFPRFLCHDT